MADELQLRIVTLRRIVVDEPVRQVTAAGTAGQFGVLPNHITFLSTLDIGPLVYEGSAGNRVLAVRGGFAEVVDNVMTVLTEAAESAEEVDEAAARRELDDAGARLSELSFSDEEYARAQADKRWAETRLDLCGKGGHGSV